MRFHQNMSLVTSEKQHWTQCVHVHCIVAPNKVGLPSTGLGKGQKKAGSVAEGLTPTLEVSRTDYEQRLFCISALQVC